MLETLPLFGWSLHSPQLPCLLCSHLHQVLFLLFFPLLHTLCYSLSPSIPTRGSNYAPLLHMVQQFHLLVPPTVAHFVTALLLSTSCSSSSFCLPLGVWLRGFQALSLSPLPLRHPLFPLRARAPLPSLCQGPHSPGSRGRGPGSPITEPPKTASLSWFLFDQNCNNYKQPIRRATFYTVSISHLGSRTTLAIICFNQFNWTKCYSK